MQPTLKIAAAQTAPEVGNVDANIAAAAALIEQARGQGVELVVFPELSLIGYDLDRIGEDPALTFELPDRRLDPLLAACDGSITAVVGLPLLEHGELSIASLVIRGGEIVDVYRKQHLHGSESSLFRAGDRPVTIDVAGWPVGLSICYDIAFPEHCRAAVAAGARLYVASCMLAAGTDLGRNLVRLHERAESERVFVLAANYAGPVAAMNAAGHSSVWGPTGTPIAMSDAEPALLTVTLQAEGEASPA